MQSINVNKERVCPSQGRTLSLLRRKAMEYRINPVKMTGQVKALKDNQLEIHLQGRLGILTVKREILLSEEIKAGDQIEFYFSYIQAVEEAENYNASGISIYHEEAPSLIGGRLTKVSDTRVEVAIMDDLGSMALPKGWVITPIPLEEGRQVEFYFSCMNKKALQDTNS